MTEVSTTLQWAYLAGPMTGIELYNFPEFEKQAAWLRGQNWNVVSPAEMDLMAGFDPEQDTPDPFDVLMRRDLKEVCFADAVVLLPDWETSKGARLEAVVAVEIGHPVFEIVGKFENRRLESINPDYIKEVFFFLQEDAAWSEPNGDDSVTLRPAPSFFVGGESNADVQPVHPNTALFHATLKRLGELHDEKSKGYGTPTDPFANVRGSTAWGVPAWVGAMVRANDKVVRLQQFIEKGELPFEAVEDAFLDLAVYAVIAYCLFMEQQAE